MKIARRLFPILLGLSVVMSAGTARPDGADSRDPVMRVMIADELTAVPIYMKKDYRITASGQGTVLMEGPCIATEIKAVDTGIMIRDKVFRVSGVRIRIEEGARSYVDRKPFRGDVEILKKDNGRLMVINHIGLDEYLYGVLYHEVSHRWPIGALKAQAIVARTFALYEARQNRSKPYDLRSDVYSQVYGGSEFERWSTTMAVKATKGRIMTYRGDIFPTYYHAACAGSTEDASRLWKIDLAPLTGVKCDYCRGSKYYRWQNAIGLGTVREELRSAGYTIGDIVSVSVVSKNGSGRAEKVLVKDSSGKSLELSGKEFRQALGPNDLRSARFDACIDDGKLVLDGMGWGHGVGMCQWGAYGQAKLGKKADEILKYYYPGAEVSSIDNVRL
jgi:stage II sporulation protein D